MAKRVFIIPGRSAGPKDSFYPLICEELRDRHIDARVVDMPNKNFPVLEKQVKKLYREVGVADPDTYFLGHSQGSIAGLSFASQLDEGQRLGGVFLVAPPLRVSPKVVKNGTELKILAVRQKLDYPFVPDKFLNFACKQARKIFYGRALLNTYDWNHDVDIDIDWEKARENCEKYVALFSKNDRYVENFLSYMDKFEETLGARILLEEKAGHFRDHFYKDRGWYPRMRNEVFSMMGLEEVVETKE